MIPEEQFDIATVERRVATHVPLAVPREDAPRRAAVAIILREQPIGGSDGALELLYIRRVEHPDDPWSGHIAFPGGHVDREDTDAVAAAIRETNEEVGIALDRDARLLGRLDDVRARANGVVLPMAVTPVVFAMERHATLTPDPAEVAAAFWLPLARLASNEHASTILYRRDGLGEVTLPCWRIDDHTIWGLTYQMTWTLLSVLGRGAVPGDPRFASAGRPRA